MSCKKVLPLVIFFIGIIFLQGCDDGQLKKAAQAKLKQAERQLDEARALGAASRAKSVFGQAEEVYEEGKSHVEHEAYPDAIKDWETFQPLIEKAKADAIASRERELAELQKKQELETDEAAKKEADRKAADLRALEELAKQEELARLKKLEATKAVPVVVVPEKNVFIVPAPQASEHGVTKGDYLYKIARALYKDPKKWAEIYTLNKDTIKDPNLIFPGQKILLPSGK